MNPEKRQKTHLTDWTFVLVAVLMALGFTRVGGKLFAADMDPTQEAMGYVGHEADESAQRFDQVITEDAGIATTQYENCTERDIAEIKSAEARGMRLLAEWKGILERRYGDVSPYNRSVSNPATHQEVLDFQAHEVVGCVRRTMLRGLTYVCNADLRAQHAVAKTVPLFGRRVKVDPRLLEGKIRLDLMATLIHEASHKCGTNDATYFSQTDHPHSVMFSEWPSIADTYYYWAAYGFCIPGVNCQ